MTSWERVKLERERRRAMVEMMADFMVAVDSIFVFVSGEAGDSVI